MTKIQAKHVYAKQMLGKNNCDQKNKKKLKKKIK